MRKVGRCLVSLLFLILTAIAVQAQTLPQMADSLGVEDASGYPGTYVEVPVNITNAKNGSIVTIEFRVEYNESVIKLVGATTGDLTANWGFSLMEGNKIRMTQLLSPGLPIQNGASGTVAILNFSVVGNYGDVSPINITDIYLMNNIGDVGTAPPKNGTFTILSLQDTTPPTLTFVDPTPNNNTAIDEKQFTVKIESNEPLMKAILYIEVWNGTTWGFWENGENIGGLIIPMNNTTDTIWWATVQLPRDVILRYYVEGCDLANNCAKTDMRYLKVSGYPPEIYVTAPGKVPLNADVNMTVTIYDATPATYKVYKNGTLVKEGSYQAFFQFNVSIDTSQVGVWSYTVWANDSFGNANQTTVIIEVFQPAVPEIIAPNVVAKPLEIVRIPIYLNNVTGATGVGFNLTFDPDVIRVERVEPNTTYFTNISIPDYNIDNTTGLVSVASISYDLATTTQPQPIVDLVVRVIANETFTYLNFTFAEISLEPPEFELVVPVKINGSVTVVGLKGDLNDNGRIDIGDVAKVGYMVVGKEQYDLRADFNLNGEIDITDLAKIASYYVGKISEL